jgi:hypothetical protein
MPARLVTDAEILSAWGDAASPGAVAKTLGISYRRLQARRKLLEAKTGKALPSINYNNTQRSMYQAAVENPALQSIYKSPTRLHQKLESGTVIIFSDAHYWPGIVSTAHRALVHLVRELRPKMVIGNGDIFDMASPSHWGRRDFSPLPNVRQEVEAVQERLGEIEDAAPRGCRLVRTIGNHCIRFTRKLVTVANEFEGLKGFALTDHFPKWQECWSIHLNSDTNGWTEIKHRWKGGVHSSFNNAKEASVHYCTGHDHALRVQEFTNRRGTWYGVNSGTLADPEGPQFSYAEDSPLNHRSGFAVLTYHKGQLLRPAICKVLDPLTVDFERQVIRV